MAIQFADDIKQTWEKVRSDNDELNWMILEVAADNKTASLVGSGNGGYDELVGTLNVEDKVYFAAFRCTAVDMDSRRAKFCFVAWIGTKVSPLKRAKVSALKSAFEVFYKGLHCEFAANSLEDIDKETVIKKLNASTGAHKPKSYEF